MFGFTFGAKDEPAKVEPQVQTLPAGQTQEAANPLDQYKDLFDPTKQTQTNIQDLTAKLFNSSDEQMDKDLANANLLTITQEQLNAMKESGMSDTAIAANLQIMNASLKNIVKMNAKTAFGAVQHGLNNSATFVDGRVTENLARANATEAVRSLGTSLDHPAMAAFRDPLINALAKNYPNSSQSELKAHAENMFGTMMQSLGYEKKAAPKPDPEAVGRDFSSWLNPTS